MSRTPARKTQVEKFREVESDEFADNSDAGVESCGQARAG
jgi:hypothetical protein